MRFFMILMIFYLCYSTNISCRPTQLEEEHDRETNDGEYESDDSADDDYLHENEQTAIDETPQSSIRQEGAIQNLIHDSRISSNKHYDYNKDCYESIAENVNIDENAAGNPIDLKYNRDEKYPIENQDPKNYATNSEVETEISQNGRGQGKNRLECRNVKDKSSRFASDNTVDILFQPNLDETNEKQKYYFKKQYNNNIFKDNRLMKNNEFSYHVDRNRRQVSSIDGSVTDINNENENNIDTTNENNILKNIKKLSEQDLEELLNSLPEDKKALLKKIMNKREITKKAGAVEDNNYLDQSDTSKIEGSFSVSSLSSLTDPTESSKHNGDGTGTKILYSETDSANSGTQHGENCDTSTIEITNIDSKNEGNLNSNDKETGNSQNKHETIKRDVANENVPLENSKYIDFEDKNINDYAVEKECSENENWFKANKETQPQKRDVFQTDAELSDSVKKLEDSFPNVNAYEDIESDAEPLLRVKRTELHHRVKKRDLSFLPSDTMSYTTDLENNEYKFNEASEFDDKDFVDCQAKKDRHIRLNRNSILNKTQRSEDDKEISKSLPVISLDGQKVVSNSDKTDLGSDTDCVLSGIEGVDDNIMLNSGMRNKRTLRSNILIDTNTINDKVNLNQNNRTKSMLHNYIHSMPDDRIDVSQHQTGTSFETLSLDSGEDFGRYKRIK